MQTWQLVFDDFGQSGIVLDDSLQVIGVHIFQLVFIHEDRHQVKSDSFIWVVDKWPSHKVHALDVANSRILSSKLVKNFVKFLFLLSGTFGFYESPLNISHNLLVILIGSLECLA